ncbi:MAG: hypothetical protein IJS25_07335 [Bacteroidales bacterium]|nr:hypothetical protein [Bacteroidales bacterium]
MKKAVAILLVMALLVMGAYIFYAMAEVPVDGGHPMPVVDLTGALVALLLIVFEFLLAWIARVIIPPIKEWLKARTTEKERGMIWDAVCKLVDAAEQIIRGPCLGERRLAYVEAGLLQRGIKVDRDLIEAAVLRMKERTAIMLSDGLEIDTGAGNDPDTENDITEGSLTEPEPDDQDDIILPPLEHWPVEMISEFCRDNNIPCEGCETKEQYIDAIVQGTNAIIEEPQSENE